MHRPAACLFDLDGLLLDTEPLHARAWLEATAAFGLHLQPDQLLALRGRRRLDCVEQVRQWLADAGLAVPSGAALLAVRQPIAEALLPTARPMPGAPSLVGRCQQLGIATALVTSSSQEAVALKAAPHPWLAAIGERVYGDDPDLAAGKPAPDPFRLAAQRLGGQRRAAGPLRIPPLAPTRPGPPAARWLCCCRARRIWSAGSGPNCPRGHGPCIAWRTCS
ncbi:MAG: HAD family hydrolase [Vulcanococcus sp.]